MKFASAYNSTIAAVLIAICLALSANNIANGTQNVTSSVEQVLAFDSPCGNTPCSEGQGSDCCDTTFCNCACYAPLGQGLRISYAPVIGPQSFLEPSGSFPQVYRPIFVPPQNPV